MSIPGGWELLLIVVIAMVLFGGNRAFSAVKTMGREIYKVKKDVDELKDDIKRL